MMITVGGGEQLITNHAKETRGIGQRPVFTPGDAPILALVLGLGEADVRAAFQCWPADPLAGGDVRPPALPVS